MSYSVHDNLDLSDATVGISRVGLENYRQDLQLHVIDDTKELLRDYKDIATAIGNGWNGRAAQKFIDNFDCSVNSACDALDQISKAIDALFEAVQNSMIKQDEEMIEEGDTAF